MRNFCKEYDHFQVMLRQFAIPTYYIAMKTILKGAHYSFAFTESDADDYFSQLSHFPPFKGIMKTQQKVSPRGRNLLIYETDDVKQKPSRHV